MSTAKSTVLITTYEDDLRMEITLRNFMALVTPEPFEMVIVNDGGRTQTEDMIRRVWGEHEIRKPTQGLVALQYHYLSPPSTDFRLAAARNLGLRRITTPQTIVCDCDTAPGPAMVEAHQRGFDDQTVLIGVRKHVRREAVEAVRDPAKCDLQWLFLSAYQDDDRVNGNVPGLKQHYLEVETSKQPWAVCWGCNFSFPTERAQRIGGFDEEFVGWGGEDEDLARRLLREGARFRALPASYVYHLDHPRRTQQVASQVFYRKMNAEVVRNGGPMRAREPVYIGRIS